MLNQINLAMHHQHRCFIATPLYRQIRHFEYKEIDLSDKDRFLFAGVLNDMSFLRPIISVNFKFYEVCLCPCIKSYSDNSIMRNAADFVIEHLNIDSRGENILFWGRQGTIINSKSRIEEAHSIYFNGYAYSTSVNLRDCLYNILEYPDYIPYNSHPDLKALYNINIKNIETFFDEYLNKIKQMDEYKLIELLIKKMTK